jgi:hypothetical protein
MLTPPREGYFLAAAFFAGALLAAFFAGVSWLRRPRVRPARGGLRSAPYDPVRRRRSDTRLELEVLVSLAQAPQALTAGEMSCAEAQLLRSDLEQMPFAGHALE